MFNTSNLVQEAPVQKYITVGINEGITLVDFTSGESKSGTPFLEVTVAKGDDSNIKDKFYFSEKAQPASLLRCIELLTAAGVDRAVIDTAAEGAKDLDDLATRFSAIVPAGNSFRMKFSGEEYMKDGEVKTAKKIPFRAFAEPTATSPSKLTFSEKYDIARLPAPDPLGAPAPANKDNDLPF